MHIGTASGTTTLITDHKSRAVNLKLLALCIDMNIVHVSLPPRRTRMGKSSIVPAFVPSGFLL